MCEIDRNDKFLNERTSIFNEFKENINTLLSSGNIKKIENYVSKLENTYKERNKLQFVLIAPLIAMACLMTNRKHKINEGILLWMRLIEIVKDWNPYLGALCALIISDLSEINEKKSMEYLKIAMNYDPFKIWSYLNLDFIKQLSYY